MVDVNKTRNSGKTASEETAEEAAKEADKTLDVDLEGTRKFRTPGFARMRTDWNSQDKVIIERANRLASERLFIEFKDGFNILSWIHDKVRTPVADDDGEIQRDENGRIIWARNEYGVYDEDYSKLTVKDRDTLLFAISTRLFGWEQKAADAWHESMQGKAQWQERHGIAFDAPNSGTQGDREAAANKDAAEERYFAVFLTSYSRRVDSFIKNMRQLQNILIKALR